MDPFTIFLIVVITILTTLLVVTGIQVILILRHVNKSLGKVNKTLDVVDNIVNKIADPLANIGSLTKGVKAGLEVADHIVSWVKEKHGSAEVVDGEEADEPKSK